MEKLAEPFHFPVDRWRIPLRLVEPHVFVGRPCAIVRRVLCFFPCSLADEDDLSFDRRLTLVLSSSTDDGKGPRWETSGG